MVLLEDASSTSKVRGYGGIAIDLMRQVLYVSDVINGQILRIHYVPFIYE
jgi:hypothetical protein